MSKTILEIVIVTWNSRIEIGECLGALEPLPKDWRVSIVDNKSSDETVDFIKRNFPNVNVIANKDNVGFAKANNQVITRTDSDYVLVLNPDAVASVNAVQAAIDKIETLPKAGALGVKILNSDGSLQPSCKRFPSPTLNFVIAFGLHTVLPKSWQTRNILSQYWSHDEERRVDWVMGSFMLVKREAINKVGSIPDEYFLYYEETDWCFQMQRSSYEVWFTPEISIMHHGNKSGEQQPSEWRTSLLYESKYKFFQRNYGRFATKITQATDFAGYTLRKWYYGWSNKNNDDIKRKYKSVQLSQSITRQWLLSK
jgi:GT2 family glycosyltransferase